MIIKKIAVGNSTEAFVEDGFTDGLNIISSDDNNKGKTIAMQSMMYAIGNEPTFPTTFDYKNTIITRNLKKKIRFTKCADMVTILLS